MVVTSTGAKGYIVSNYLEDPAVDPVVGDPDDPTTAVLDSREVLCWTDAPGPTVCTRHKGHPGAHAFGSDYKILKVWS